MNKDAVIVNVNGHRMFSDRVPVRIYDWLDQEGGWHRDRAIAARLGISAAHVNRSLYRMRNRGIVVKRGAEWKAA